jgi:hypothetical protein
MDTVVVTMIHQHQGSTHTADFHSKKHIVVFTTNQHPGNTHTVDFTMNTFDFRMI